MPGQFPNASTRLLNKIISNINLLERIKILLRF